MIVRFIWMGLVAVFLGCFSSPCSAEELPYPYDSIEVLPPDHHGFCGNPRQLREIFEEEEIHTVIEVGTWLGKSAMFMARRLPEGGKVYAVDHWLGSEEHQEGEDFYHEAMPRLYQQFLSNVIDRGLAHKIVPVRKESTEAAAELDVYPDLIYIDASHDYLSVKRDLEAWFLHVTDGCVFCGDDWRFPGVRQAVTEFAEERGFEVHSDKNFWRILY